MSADASVRPQRVVAAGIEWLAADDDHALGAWLGYDLAVRHGISEKPRNLSSEPVGAEAERVTGVEG